MPFPVGIPIPVGTDAYELAITPDSTTAWVTSQSTNTLIPVDLNTGTVGTPIALLDSPTRVAINPAGTRAFVTLPSSTPDHKTEVIDLGSHSLFRIITTPGPALDVVVTPDGTTAWVLATTTLVPYDIASDTVGSPVPLGGSCNFVAITPDSQTAWATRAFSGIIPVDLASHTAGSVLPVGTGPWAIAIDHTGTVAYVTDQTAGTLIPVNLATLASGAPVSLGTLPFGASAWTIALTPDGRDALVVIRGRDVIPVSLASLSPLPQIVVGSPLGQANAIAVTPDRTAVWVARGVGDQIVPIGLTRLVTPPTRQFPRDDNLARGAVRQRVGVGSSSQQNSYRQGWRGTYS
jgi:DNA-binding beta-propeller fold protein YncE